MRRKAVRLSGGMPRKPSSNTEQVVIRVPEQWVKDAEGEIATLLAQPGMPVTKTDAFRVSIAHGFEAIRAAHAPRPAGAEKLIADVLGAIPPAEVARIIVQVLDNAALTKLVTAFTAAKKGASPTRKPKS